MLHELFTRELLLFVTIFAIGLGPALMLRHAEASVAARVALAPGFGLAIGSGVLMLADYFVPLRHSWFFVVVSLAAGGVWLARRAATADGQMWRLPWRGVGAILVVGLVAAGVGNYTLRNHGTVAPVGYGIYDASGYVSFIEGFEARTNDKPLGAAPPDWPQARWDHEAWSAPWDLAQRYGWGYKFQHTASEAVNASVTGAGGWAPWTMVSPFMVVLLAAGALGVFGLAGVLGVRGGPQLLAGLLYSGPLVYTAMSDGSQGLLAGLAVLPAVIAATALALERPSKRAAVLAGVAFGGLQAVYPELLAGAVAGMGLALLALVAMTWRRSRRGAPITRGAARRVVGLLTLAGVAGLLVSPRTLPWTWNYVAAGDYKNLAKTVIQYNMELRYLPGWLFQTREFYSFSQLHPGGFVQTFVGVLLPLLLIATCAYAVVALPRLRPLLGLVLFLFVQAWAVSRSLGCSYCAQRTLLALSPVVPVLLGGGLFALLRAGGRARDLGIALGTVVLVAVSLQGWGTMQRMKTGLISMPSQRLEKLADVIGHDTSGGIALEGFDAVPLSSWLELPVTYDMVKEANPQRVSVAADHNNWGGLSYFGTRPEDAPAWNPDYQWVLTRIGGFDHSRQEIFRQGPISLQRRAVPFDVIVTRGVAVDQQVRDPAGVPWLQQPGNVWGGEQGPLSLRVAAASPATAYVRFELHGPPNVSVARQRGMTRQRTAPGVLDVCVPAPGPSRTRDLSFAVTPDPGPLTYIGVADDHRPSPAKTIQLFRVGASAAPCSKR